MDLGLSMGVALCYYVVLERFSSSVNLHRNSHA